ncbi:MAG: phosphatidylglycerol lysyltransferase domain-containing protein [Smithellaceae bacterium]|nr:phosphatidylglycerol lysyltransferase domain-containing protein [Smithellaceae bacterium]
MNFKPIEVGDYPLLKPYFAEQSYDLSVYSLMSIIVWSSRLFTASYIIEDGSVIISSDSVREPEDRHLILPVGAGAARNPEELRELARRMGFQAYHFVPETYLEKYPLAEWERLFVLCLQPEYEDYLYLTDDLVELKGNKFSKKRNLLHQFDRSYLRADRISVEDVTASNAEECLSFLEKWCSQRDCDEASNQYLACEKQAAIKAIEHIKELEAAGIAVRVDGEVCAFGIGSRLTKDTAVLNFEKAFSEIKGLYQFLDNQCARRLFAGYRYINKESDMGIEELAQSKNSYNPIRRIKSYLLTCK